MNENTKINASARDAAESAVSFEYVSAYEEWSTAGIGNTFLFGKVMTSVECQVKLTHFFVEI